MRNVVIVCLDTVRADYFNQYADRLQSLADLCLTGCHAPSCSTGPSHSALLTGSFPSEFPHPQFEDVSLADTFLSELDTYTTAAITGSGWLNEAFGKLFDRHIPISPQHRFPFALPVDRYAKRATGQLRSYLQFVFDAIHHEAPLRSLGNGLAAQIYRLSRDSPLPVLLDDGAAAVTRQAQKFVRDNPEPIFLYVNYIDAHEPLHDFIGHDDGIADPPRGWTSSKYHVEDLRYGQGSASRATGHAEFLSTYRDLYAATVEYLDRICASLIETIQHQTTRETTIIITADHGEGLGFERDGYNWGHLNSMHQSVLHVPCVIVNPPCCECPDANPLHSLRHLGDLITTVADGEWVDTSVDRIGAEYASRVNPDRTVVDDPTLINRVVRSAHRSGKKVIWDSHGRVKSVALDQSFDRLSPPRELETPPSWATATFSNDIPDLDSWQY